VGELLHFVDGVPVHDKLQGDINAMLSGPPWSDVHLCISSEHKTMISVRRSQHGWIGLVFRKIPDGPLIVDHLLPNSPLARLGSDKIRRGDFVHSIGTVRCEKVYSLSSDAVTSRLIKGEPASNVWLVVSREQWGPWDEEKWPHPHPHGAHPAPGSFLPTLPELPSLELDRMHAHLAQSQDQVGAFVTNPEQALSALWGGRGWTDSEPQVQEDAILHDRTVEGWKEVCVCHCHG
jgi:hypothetical protein